MSGLIEYNLFFLLRQRAVIRTLKLLTVSFQKMKIFASLEKKIIFWKIFGEAFNLPRLSKQIKPNSHISIRLLLPTDLSGSS